MDNGKPHWVKMLYRITGAESKRPEKPNKYHHRMTGKRCGIEYLGRGSMCYLWIEGLQEWEEYSRFYTTTVMDIRGEDGVMTIETENSVYTLTREEGIDHAESETYGRDVVS